MSLWLPSTRRPHPYGRAPNSRCGAKVSQRNVCPHAVFGHGSSCPPLGCRSRHSSGAVGDPLGIR